MRFTTMTDEEASARSSDLWPDGIYDYEVRDALEETSSKGNEMTKLEVWVFNKAGGRRLIFSYLVANDKSAWKIHEFAASCGLMQQYKTGNLMVADIVGRTGQCKVGTQKGTDEYPNARNIILSYVKAKDASQPIRSATSTREKTPAGGDLDDEIPF